MMSSIFISYSRIDNEIADRIVNILSDLSIAYFRDVKDIKWGDAINSTLRTAIHSCAAVLVIISPGSLKSQWVPYEIGHAAALGKTILPFLTHPSIDIPLYMRDLNFVTTYDQVRDYFVHLSPKPEELPAVATNPPTDSKLTLEILGGASSALSDIARMTSRNIEETVCDALTTYRWILGQQLTGRTIVARDSDPSDEDIVVNLIVNKQAARKHFLGGN
jgi:hypothetical protein